VQYSWPGPLPPGARRGTIKFVRCARCKGSLYHTKLKRQPRQEDHEQGCVLFIKAIRITQYVDELKRAASQSVRGSWLGTRRQRKYLLQNAKKLSVAACEGDPVAAISELGDAYQAECQAGGQRAEITPLAEMLMRACWQLALGRVPAPVIVGPQVDA
jgi:hypothetical protein